MIEKNHIIRGYLKKLLIYSGFLLLWGMVLGAGRLSAQSPPPADCRNALEISPLRIYSSPLPPQGPGEVIEFSGEDPKSLYYFEEEHHTAWYTFRIPIDGKLRFDIIPEKIGDDYDFILFKVEGEDFCEAVRKKQIRPVRTCISRNDTLQKSMTGLSPDGTANYIHSGPGSSWANPLPVRKGERYVLVLDNVYENGGRHKIRFYFHIPFTFTGKVTADSSGIPPQTRVVLEDAQTGELIAETDIDPETGTYSLPTELDLNRPQTLVFRSPDHFYQIQPIDPKSLAKSPPPSFDADLPSLEVGKSFVLEGIRFRPNTPILTRPSVPNVNRLLLFLLDYPKVHIELEGHTNCAGNLYGPNAKDQPLSEARAKKVYDWLVDGGIDPDRLSRRGYGCSRMLFPNAKTLEVQKKNMRVEVKITQM